MPRHKKESLGKRSRVYKKLIGITQVASTRTTRDVHRPHAWESHAMCIGHMCMRITWNAHVGSSMRRDSPVFLGIFFSIRNWYRNIQIQVWALFSRSLSIMVFKALFYAMLDLESSKDRCMLPMRCRAWEWSNLGFLTPITFC